MRDRLDALVAIGDDHPHSPLHQIKASSSNPVGRWNEAASGEAGGILGRPAHRPAPRPVVEQGRAGRRADHARREDDALQPYPLDDLFS